MLSLPYDYDALSLGLLKYQVRSVTVPLKENPPGCLLALNSSCQNRVIGRALLKNVTISIDKVGVVCVQDIKDYGFLKLYTMKTTSSTIVVSMRKILWRFVATSLLETPPCSRHLMWFYSYFK